MIHSLKHCFVFSVNSVVFLCWQTTHYVMSIISLSTLQQKFEELCVERLSMYIYIRIYVYIKDVYANLSEIKQMSN